MTTTTRSGILFQREAVLAVAGAITLLILGCPSAWAQDDDNRTTQVMVRHLDLHPRSPQEMQRTLDRLAEAATRACGGEPFGYGENRSAIVASPCWRDAMRAATARVHAPPSRLAAAGIP